MTTATRRRILGLAAAAVAGLFVWQSGWLAGAAEHGSGPRSALPNLWEWRLNKVPPAAPGDELRLVLRVKSEPLPADGSLIPPARKEPLLAGEGADRPVVAETLAGVQPDEVRVGFQLIDLRQLGVKVSADEVPLRLTGGFEFGSAFHTAQGRADGFALRNVAAHPADRWADGELPLLTFVTMSQDEQFTYTLLLAVGRAD